MQTLLKYKHLGGVQMGFWGSGQWQVVCDQLGKKKWCVCKLSW